MQNDFISGVLGSDAAKAIVPNVKKKIEEYYANDYVVVFTQDTHTADTYETTMESKTIPLHCDMDTWGHDVPDELKYLDGYCTSIYKERFGSFNLYETIKEEVEAFIDLGKIKIDNEAHININNLIEEIELVGLCTDICVISNALILRAQVGEETLISCDSSCCAGTSIEAHNAALTVMKSCQIEVR
jgi:nicotinamidase-related amidase